MEVEEKAPIFQVPEVVFDVFGEVGVTAQAVDLCPAGHAGFGVVAGVAVGDVVFDAALALEDGAARFEPNEGAEEGDDGGGEDEAADDVGGALDGPVEGAIEGEAIDAEDGVAGDGFAVKAGNEDAEVGGDDFELDEFAFAEGGEAGEFVALSVEVSDDDHVDFVTSEEALDLREGAEVRGAILIGGFFEGGVCGSDHTDDAEGGSDSHGGAAGDAAAGGAGRGKAFVGGEGLRKGGSEKQMLSYVRITSSLIIIKINCSNYYENYVRLIGVNIL